MHIFDTDSAAIGITKNAEDVAELHKRFATKATGCNFAIEIPERQTMCDGIEVRVDSKFEFEWVDICHEVATATESVDELLNSSGLVNVIIFTAFEISVPANRNVGDTKRGENLVVEAIGTKKKFVDASEEISGLGALDDAVIVGTG